MKARIISVEFVKQYEQNIGKGKTVPMFLHEISYGEGKTGYYRSKKKEQSFFKEGEEAEFVVQEMEKDGRAYDLLKPVYPQEQFTSGRKSNFGRKLTQEQSKYSGFSTSYAKDLVIAKIIPFEELLPVSEMLFNHMVKLDKSLET